uniref:Complement C1r n=1 Tax=Gallus gallus TaxID=9031 RepID=A0A8V0ZVU6_CHICK
MEMHTPFLLWATLFTGVISSGPVPRKLFGEIRSPNYPKPYPNNNISSWDIIVPKGYVVKLTFRYFDLEPSETCFYDYVKIRADKKSLGRYCGQLGSTTGNHPGRKEFVSKGNRMHLSFHSDFSNEDNGVVVPYRGFLAYYKAVVVNCGSPAKLTNGIFSYVNKPANNTYQSVITYQCNEPYYHIVTRGGGDRYTCSSEGTWVDRDGQKRIPACLPVCGKPDNPVIGVQRIVGGKKAREGNFPWQALTEIHGRGGGALLSDRWILTAAHTIFPKGSARNNVSLDELAKDASIFLGHSDVEQIIRMGNHPVHRIFIHPDYNPNDEHNYNGDIALLELKYPVTLGPTVLPICLPDTSNTTFYMDGYMGYVSGFGVEKNFLSNNLKYVQLPAVSREKCQSWLDSKKRENPMVFSENMFCAGFLREKRDTCQGDSGSAFTVLDLESGRWVATGIVSWGIGCAQGYGFYTKILGYLDWIKGIIKEDTL